MRWRRRQRLCIPAEGDDVLQDGIVVVKRWQVVDPRGIEDDMPCFLSPIYVLLHTHLTVCVQALWAAPATNELDYGVWAVRCVQGARKSDAYRMPGECGGHLRPEQGSKELPELAMQDSISERLTIFVGKESCGSALMRRAWLFELYVANGCSSARVRAVVWQNTREGAVLFPKLIRL